VVTRLQIAMYERGIACEHSPVRSSEADRGAAVLGDPHILAVHDRTLGGRLSVAGQRIAALPPASFFVISAIFHYLGPSFAVLLFAHVSVLGVAWLRIASAAVVFALWRRPWRLVQRLTRRQRSVLLALGVVLAAMNSLFYLAIDRLPLSTVGAIEFLGIVILAALGARTRRNLAALVLAVGGVAALTNIRIVDEPLGFAFAFANCALFMLYVILGHKIANSKITNTSDDAGRTMLSGIDQLGAAMLIAALVAIPLGISGALPAFVHPSWLLWAIVVGLCSSVIPYVADQLAMARLPRATFALMLALLPATAAGIGLVVLRQVPTPQDLLGIALVIGGVALHQDRHQP
jgi:inner membrane transporter RhtA